MPTAEIDYVYRDSSSTKGARASPPLWPTAGASAEFQLNATLESRCELLLVSAIGQKSGGRSRPPDERK